MTFNYFLGRSYRWFFLPIILFSAQMSVADIAEVELPTTKVPFSYELHPPIKALEDPHAFSGLATFYNGVRPLKIDQNGEVEYLDLPATIELSNDNEWVGWKGRFKVYLISAKGATVELSDNKMILKWTSGTPSLKEFIGEPNELLSTISYSHLWNWLANLSRLAEWTLVQIQSSFSFNWGWAIVLFTVLVKFVTLPVSLLTTKLQKKVAQYQSLLLPKMAEIKQKYDGAEAHQLLMAEYKKLGITPFYTLKPLFGSLIQIPIAIAIFNALGEMPQLVGSSFLWIPSLAYPDTLIHLPFTIPFFGNGINVLPFLMTLVTIMATLSFQNAHAPAAELRKQKRNLYLMSAAFFVLFYPFPAAMVLYWMLANVVHFAQQQLIRA